MKFIYIPTQYKLIYDYLEKSIKKALQQLCQVHILNDVRSLDSLVMKRTNFPFIAFTLLGDQLSKSLIDQLKRHDIKLAVWLTEDPFYMDETINVINNYDYVFTIDSGAFNKYVDLGFSHVYHIPLGTDPTVFTAPNEERNEHSDVLLVGHPYPSRVRLIQFLLKHGNFHITVVGKNWHNHVGKMFRTHPNLTIINQWIPPEKVTDFYQKAKIVLNPHRQFSSVFNKNSENIPNRTMNNRTFDIASCRAFQLIEAVPDLRLFFTEEEVISYNGFLDCLKNIQYFLDKASLRKQISEKMRRKVLKEHTFQNRIETMIDIIQNN